MDEALREERPARCGWCARGIPADDGGVVLCAKKGVMDPDDCCPRYRYDPLRRTPAARPALPRLEEKDFQL